MRPLLAGLFCASIALGQQNAQEWLAKGEKQFAQREFAAARKSFEQAAATDGQSFLVFRALGLCDLELHDYDSAYRNWLKALELNGNDLRTQYYLGRLFYDSDLPGEAAVYLRQVVEKAPDDYAALTYLGLSAEATGFEETARDLYRKAIYESNQQKKPYSWAYLALANLLVKRGDEAGARAALMEGEERCPEAQLLATLGDLLAKAGEKQRAEAVLRRSIGLNSSLARSHYRLALLLKSDGLQEEAHHEMEAFQEAKAREAAMLKPQALRKSVTDKK